MNNRVIQFILGLNPARLPRNKPIVAIGEIVVNLVSLPYFKYMQNEHIDYELGQNNNCCEREVILEIGLANFVILRNFGLICKVHNEKEHEGYKEKCLCLRRISIDRT